MKKLDFKSSVMKGVENQAQGAKQPVRSRPTLEEMAAQIESREEKPVKREVQPKSKPKPERKQLPVKDAFSCTKDDLTELGKLLERSRKLGIRAKKSEIIRAGIWFLSESTDTQFREVLNSIPQIPTGRPSSKQNKSDKNDA